MELIDCVSLALSLVLLSLCALLYWRRPRKSALCERWEPSRKSARPQEVARLQNGPVGVSAFSTKVADRAISEQIGDALRKGQEVVQLSAHAECDQCKYLSREFEYTRKQVLSKHKYGIAFVTRVVDAGEDKGHTAYPAIRMHIKGGLVKYFTDIGSSSSLKKWIEMNSLYLTSVSV